MSSTIDKVRNLLLQEVQEKMQKLPFGFGQEEGCEGFFKWCVYIDTNNQLYGRPSLTSSFDKTKSVMENLTALPMDTLTILAEDGLSGDELFKQMHNDYVVGNGMCGKAWQDAEAWKNSQTVKNKL